MCDMSLAIVAMISVSSIRLHVQTQLLIEGLSTSDFTIRLNWSYRLTDFDLITIHLSLSI
jgi:hypothetical protein